MGLAHSKHDEMTDI